ncbi:single-stranded DNA-binding protein [Candidatus Frankia nodulisporulans]|uniref:single-stranded DNA-binding protein n=1 Tax=Candidatus Frankia nodulisporulans TaxID=2060052 RepID=UPI001CDCAAF4|nr:single-stranded DNA-binding protein [Candidatus Frankia nodulisporulans]
MLDTTITVVGNLVDAPELRVTAGGASVCSFRLASTPRRFDRAENRWVDGATLFVRVSCWRQLADNVASSLTKGGPGPGLRASAPAVVRDERGRAAGLLRDRRRGGRGRADLAWRPLAATGPGQHARARAGTYRAARRPGRRPARRPGRGVHR